MTEKEPFDYTPGEVLSRTPAPGGETAGASTLAENHSRQLGRLEAATWSYLTFGDRHLRDELVRLLNSAWMRQAHPPQEGRPGERELLGALRALVAEIEEAGGGGGGEDWPALQAAKALIAVVEG